MSSITQTSISGLILAGGQGSRVGYRDKGLLLWKSKPLIEHVLSNLEPQVESLIISCNRNYEAYQQYGHPVVTDSLDNFPGPLAGVHAGMKVLESTASHCFICPCDCPTLPPGMIPHLLDGLRYSGAVGHYVRDCDRDQYLFALFPTTLSESLESYLANGQRSVKGWYDDVGITPLECASKNWNLQNLNEPGPEFEQ
jgi:molybdenum cofactor guanylyltransferase